MSALSMFSSHGQKIYQVPLTRVNHSSILSGVESSPGSQVPDPATTTATTTRKRVTDANDHRRTTI